MTDRISIERKAQKSDANNNCSSNERAEKAQLELDGWKILDPENDDYQSSDDIQVNRCESEGFQVSQADSCGLTKGDTAYVELDHLSEYSNTSPNLVYICTAIYSLLPLASLIAFTTFMVLLFTRYYYVTLLYAGYVFWNRKACNTGGQRWSFIYNSSFWSYLGAYFPIRLRYPHTFQLDPSQNYILSYHPHGISAFGSVVALATNGFNITKLFPGIISRFMVHETSFYVPIMRETFAFRGDCSVNSGSIDHMLTKEGSGNILTIVVGGLAEADLSDMETLKIVVAKRKGFIKKALIHGANLIPCIAFGENSVFTKVNYPANSLMYRFENTWHKLFGFKHPVYHGRCIFTPKLKGVMPYKRPITVVMGDPIMVKDKTPNPSQKEIDNLHEIYLNRLKSLYDDNKHLCKEFDKQILIL